MTSLTLTKAITNALIVRAVPANLQPPSDRGRWWWPVVRESSTGAWQRNLVVQTENVLTYSPLFRCVSLISSDVAKNRLMLVEQSEDGIWSEIHSSAFSPLLARPNIFQNRIQFLQNWLESKLIHGNAYILKERDLRNVVEALYVLDPARVKPLVAPDGSVYYELRKDNLAGLDSDSIVVPASEIIHDRWNTLFHPLVGISPIYACGTSAVQGLAIQNNSASYFQNGATAPGILTAPNTIPDATATRIKDHWEANYTGDNSKRIAVLGDGLEYKPMSFNAVDSQLTEQLKATAESVCTAYGMPCYKIGVGPMPTYTNIQSLALQYYSDALQIHIESIELLLDEGLGLTAISGRKYGVELDTDNLLRMDTATLIDSEVKAVRGSVKAPNESRRRLNLKPVVGGNSPLAQHQDYTLEQISRRQDIAALPAPAKPANDDDEDDDDDGSPEALAAAAQLAAWRLKALLGEGPIL